MTQRYTYGPALENMDHGLCPECGEKPDEHSSSPYFWERNFNACDLLPQGVRDRIAAHLDGEAEA